MRPYSVLSYFNALFGEVWAREEQLPLPDRRIVTVVALWRRDWRTVLFATIWKQPKRTASQVRKWRKYLTHAA